MEEACDPSFRWRPRVSEPPSTFFHQGSGVDMVTLGMTVEEFRDDNNPSDLIGPRIGILIETHSLFLRVQSTE